MRRWALALALLGCDPALELDATPGLDGAPDAARPDARTPDATPRDGAPPPDAHDASPADAATLDAGTLDAAWPDAGPADAGPADASPPDAAPPDAAEGPAWYPPDRLVSPLTPAQVRHLRAVVRAGPARDARVFAKIGASATASTSFVHCFAGDAVDLGGRDALASTVAHFLAGDAAGTTPYQRESLCAVPGRSAGWAIGGDPAPVDQELAAVDPRFGVVMYGTNDLQLRDIDAYAANLLTLTDRLLAAGTLPILSSIMPRDDDPEADARVPGYNAVVRAVAQARQVPFVDLHLALAALPDHGIGADGIHPTTYRAGGRSRACDFTAAGLTAGYNWRNLLTIQALHGLVEAVLGDAPAPDAPSPVRDAFTIDRLPFSALADTRTGARDLDAYPGCDAPQDESGPEHVYRLVLDRPTVIQAHVLDRGDVDVDLHLLADARDPGTCLVRAHTSLQASLEAGTWYLVADTFTSRGGVERAGEYLLVVLEEPP
ncbi:MAG: SGNH/GDSL hydrolase family protein [Myxococcales bacterium]|nr:SGNH/GDSL hydrolase family protein [Myxococcales bacterium]